MITNKADDRSMQLELAQESNQGFARASAAFIVLSILLAVAYAFFFPQIVGLLEVYASSDHQITSEGIRQVGDVFLCLDALLFVVGVTLAICRNRAGLTKITRLFLADQASHSFCTRLSIRFISVVSFVVGVFLVVHINLYNRDSNVFKILYGVDGVFESMTPLLMILSVLLLGRTLLRLRRLGNHRPGIYLLWLYAAMMLMLFFDAGEEIQWGQSIFHWSTPAAMSGNIENETNVHNYFNPYFPSLYRSFVIVPLLPLLSVFLEIKKRSTWFARFALPHPGMLGLACIIAVVALVRCGEQELLEELLAVFALFYSLRVYSCFQAADTVDKMKRMLAPH